MRAVPLGVIKNKEELTLKAKMQVAITHATDIAIKSSCAVALAAHFGLHKDGKRFQ